MLDKIRISILTLVIFLVSLTSFKPVARRLRGGEGVTPHESWKKGKWDIQVFQATMSDGNCERLMFTSEWK